jgi:lysophospholipase L1-like esterase
MVLCSVTDSVGQSSCSFRVEVARPARRLRFSRLLAFGDSVTMGFLRDPTDHTMAARPRYVSPVENYPYLLEQMLRERYGDDGIVVLNRGVGGEELPEGQDRIEDVLATDKPEVILILHGFNEVHTLPTSEARAALRAIARTSQVNGVEVVLATLFQVGDDREDTRPGSQDAIAALNVEIRRLGSSLGLGGVADLELAFGKDRSLLGSDGLHPNPAGYQRIAEVMRDEIIRRFEEIPPPDPSPAAPSRAPFPSRQSFSRRSGH